ncbi:hypothetical protein GNF80_00010 [Clostridium perfringens]|nr:hypothetical protein [Clostridium perfringens]
MDMLEVAKKVTERVQKRIESLKVDINLNVLIDEEIKRECIGTDQSNQCTHENIQENYNIF